MKNTYKVIITVFSMVLAAVAVVSINVYKTGQQEKLAEEQIVLNQGMNLYMQGQYQEALTALDGVEDTTRNWQILYYKGAASVRLKEYPAAAAYLEQANALNNTDTQTLYLLGVVYFKLGKLKLAEAYFAATLEQDPAHEQAKGLMGVMSDLQKLQDQPAGKQQEPGQTE
jgi:tetratricopeptide (TPR) repeat protein